MNVELPHYTDQTPEVKKRFDELKSRKVILDIQNLNRVFETGDGEVVALKNINFKAYRREFVCVVGPSGCGKSTFIRILAGLDEPTSGQVLVDGNSVSGPGPDRGMVFQRYTLFPWLTVKQNVMFGLEMSNHSKTESESQALQWIDLVGLEKFANAYPDQLSGGMRQRVAIARALANRPRILLMDEPFGALDAQTRCQMQSYLMQIWRNVDITIVFITHDLDESLYLADRVLVLKANPGEVQEIIEVPVPRPRNPDQFVSPEFLATKKHLDTLIHPQDDEEKDDLPIMRMTNVGDEVE